MAIQRQETPHPTQGKTPAQITYRLIKEYKREPLNEGNTQNQIVWWIVQWCRSETPVLEKRRIYVSSKTGSLKTYKQMPWNLADFKWFGLNYQDIFEHLQQ